MLRVTLCAGLAAAVIVTVAGVPDGAAVALNVPVADPSAIVIVAGTVTVAVLLVKVTDLPPAGAAPVRVTVHRVLVPAMSVAEAHSTLLTRMPELIVS